MTTSSAKKNYNILALRGAPVDDMEYIETFGLPEEYAYTPKLNEAMLDKMVEENVYKGMDRQEAMKIRATHAKGIKKLLANKGMLK